MDAKKQNYIDGVRGWAILMVITCHVGSAFAELPYPVRKITNFGWHGVQLFFLASAITLLMSWHRSQVHDMRAVKYFFLRRFLRIAPMYYSGALIYFIADPPATGFDLAQLLRAFTFVNVLRPDWVPTTGGWMVVPGGWSIGVEFTFYAMFPVLATMVTSLQRAAVLSLAAMVIAVASNWLGSAWLSGVDPISATNFLYFWYPNQLPVFALGFIMYFVVSRPDQLNLSKRIAYASLIILAMAYVVAAEYCLNLSRFTLDNLVPPIFVASLIFMGFIFVLARGPETLATHPIVRRIGVLSFSAYVLHFLFIEFLPAWSGGWIDVHATGYAAIANFAAMWLLTVACTVLAATAAHVMIEQPGIELARRLTSRRVPRLVAGD